MVDQVGDCLKLGFNITHPYTHVFLDMFVEIELFPAECETY